MGNGWLFILIAMLVVVPFLLIGLSEIYKTAQTVHTSVSTRGTVMDNVFRPFVSDGAACVPVIEFQTRDGHVVRFTDAIGSYPPDYEVGTEVNVLYDPDDVQDARVNSWKRIWLAPTLITSAGLPPILIAVSVVWVVGRKAAF